MENKKGIKAIPKDEINPIFLLPIDERMDKVNELLKNLQNITPDISFFDLDEEVSEAKEERCRNGE